MKRAIIKQLENLIKAATKFKNQILFDIIAKEEGLKPEEIKLLKAVIACESDWDDKAINFNPNRTIDFGLCQFNDYWYWESEKIISPKDAFYNPELAIKTMIQQYKKGRLRDWVCYSSKKYKNYL